jgi:putative heme-binding domain-containing protein
MRQRTSLLAGASFGALLFTAGVLTADWSARQVPADVAMPGSSMTRQQVMDRLTSTTPGTTVSGPRGQEIYEAVCAACHIFGDTGTSIGPDLTTLSSRFRRADVLEAMLWPSRTISDQYAVTVFELTDGTIESGVIIREDSRAVYLKNADHLERPLPIALGRIAERTESTVSLMPEHLLAPYTLDEIDSLVTYMLGGS